MPSVTVRLATDQQTHRNVRCFWYHVYCEVRGVLRHKADHSAKELDDPLMRKARLFVAVGDDDAVIGTIMSTYARETDLEPYTTQYELKRHASFPHSASITTKFMVLPGRRGSRVAVRLAKAAFDQGLRDGITHNFIDCNRPLFPLFESLGYRAFVGWKQSAEFGDVCIMSLGLIEDEAYMRQIGSFFVRELDTD